MREVTHKNPLQVFFQIFYYFQIYTDSWQRIILKLSKEIHLAQLMLRFLYVNLTEYVFYS